MRRKDREDEKTDSVIFKKDSSPDKKKNSLFQLEDLEKILNETDKQYTHFFQNLQKRPPVEKREKIEHFLRHFSLYSTTLVERFKWSNFRIKYTLFSKKWDLGLSQRESTRQKKK